MLIAISFIIHIENKMKYSEMTKRTALIILGGII